MSNNKLNRILVILLPFLFIGTIIIPSISSNYSYKQDNLSLTFYTFDKTGTKKCKVEISTNTANIISNTFEELKYIITNDPTSSKTKTLKNSFVELLDRYDLIPQGTSKDYVFSLLNPRWLQQIGNNNPFTEHIFPRFRASAVKNDVLPMQSPKTGSAFFCSLAGSGRGLIFTPIIFPRPRLLTLWSARSSAVSTAANLYTGHGFVASGGQTGIALGFWGVGLSFAIPGEPAFFGFGGYALLTLVRADDIETYPPNQKPIISDENPPTGTWDVPVSLSELSFRISDPDGDRMSYWATTDPDIGSGEGHLKNDGVYSVVVSGLEYDKSYRFTIRVSDGKDTVEKQSGFITQIGPPIDPFDEGWQYRKKITIENNMVAGSLTDFPVLVSVVDSDLAIKAQSDGDDILFMDGSGVAKKLYHEIEEYVDSSGKLVAWVNVDSISGSSDTDFYMYYGNPSCSSQHFPEKVWNANYCGVWHLNEISGTIFDSTFNDNDGTNSGATFGAIGKVGKSLDFECDDPDKVTFPHSPSLNLESEVTIELWFKPESFKYERGTLCTKQHCYYTNILETGQVSIYTYWNDDGSKGKSTYMDANTPMTIGNWHHIAWSESKDGLRKIFINGILDVQGYFEASIWSQYSTTYMGHNDYNNKDRRVDGVLDEVRISNIARSADWISTEYNNQNDPSDFLSFSPEESA